MDEETIREVRHDAYTHSAVVGSLCRKGVFRHNGLDDMDAGVELADSQIAAYA